MITCSVTGTRDLPKCCTMDPDAIITEVEASGLRGRGGGGFPTGPKWRSCKAVESDVRYVMCNGDEGDPGAFMDRSIMEGDPHSVLEGMIIGAYAVGAHMGYIYVRDEYPLAVKNLGIAINQARAMGLLGKNILGSELEFNIEIKEGAGAFVCGESTALVASLEGERGTPAASTSAALRIGGRSVEHADEPEQCRDLCQRPHDHHQGSGLLYQDRHREIQRHQSVRPYGKDQEHRSIEVPMELRSAKSSSTLAVGMLNPDRGFQSGPDRRPLGRMHPGPVPRHAGGF